MYLGYQKSIPMRMSRRQPRWTLARLPGLSRRRDCSVGIFYRGCPGLDNLSIIWTMALDEGFEFSPVMCPNEVTFSFMKPTAQNGWERRRGSMRSPVG